MLQRVISLNTFLSSLPGKLSVNVYVRSELSRIFLRRQSLASIFSEMFDGQNDPGNDWRRTDWLCYPCVLTFLSLRTYSWFIRELIKGMQNEPCSQDQILTSLRRQMTINSKRTAGTCYCDISFPNIGLTSGLFLRYGWNCRTQTHKPDHAKKLNVRLCFPFSVRN